MINEIKGNNIILREQKIEDAKFLPIGTISHRSCFNVALRNLLMKNLRKRESQMVIKRKTQYGTQLQI